MGSESFRKGESANTLTAASTSLRTSRTSLPSLSRRLSPQQGGSHGQVRPLRLAPLTAPSQLLSVSCALPSHPGCQMKGMRCSSWPGPLMITPPPDSMGLRAMGSKIPPGKALAPPHVMVLLWPSCWLHHGWELTAPLKLGPRGTGCLSYSSNLSTDSRPSVCSVVTQIPVEKQGSFPTRGVAFQPFWLVRPWCLASALVLRLQGDLLFLKYMLHYSFMYLLHNGP